MSTLKSAGAIASEIVGRLERITVANGAETDIGLKVMQGRRKMEEDLTPSVTLVEGEDQPDTISGKLVSAAIVQRYVVIGYSPCDYNNPNLAAHAMLRDMKRAMFSADGVADAKFGGKVLAVEYRGRNIGVREDGSQMVMAVMEFDVRYVEDLSNP